MTREDRFVLIFAWLGMSSGVGFLLLGAWAFWVAHTSVLLVLGVVTLGSSIALRHRYSRIGRLAAQSNHGHRPLAEALDGGGVDAGGGDEDSEGLA